MEQVGRKPQAVSSEAVLAKVKELMKQKAAKEWPGNKLPLGIDSLALYFQVSAVDILPFIEELEKAGHLQWHPPAAISKRQTNWGSVSLTEWSNG